MPQAFFSLRSLGSGFVKISLIGLFAIVGLLPVRAANFQSDLKVTLGIDIGDGPVDFSDADKTIEKGRFVTYQIRVANQNSTDTLKDLTLLMESPDTMGYVPNSATQKAGGAETPSPLPDVGSASALSIGYPLESLAPGEEDVFTLQFQVAKELDDTHAYALAWATVTDLYSALPRVSDTVENRVFGESKSALQATVEALPPAGTGVNTGSQIAYNYSIRNVGGVAAQGVILTTHLPEDTKCVSGCGSESVGSLGPNESGFFTMVVEVGPVPSGTSSVTNSGYDLAASGISTIQNRDAIVHPIDVQATPAAGDFNVTIVQRPNLVLNSPNGQPRPDHADVSETKYTFNYVGRKSPITYPALSKYGGYVYRDEAPCSATYPNVWHAQTVAYNSSGGYCDDISSCPLSSAPIPFGVSTVLPSSAPKLVFTQNVPSYTYGSSTYEVNNFMKNGGAIAVPVTLTEGRAVENGAVGIVSTEVSATVSEDRWEYVQYSTDTCTYSESCGDGDSCDVTVDIPLYRWEKVQSTPIPLKAADTTDISVYTSTAWLKTKGGNLGTNDQFTNGAETPANLVDLGVPEFSNLLTPSNLYTPPGETNADAMVFGKNGTGDFVTKAGDAWKVDGTTFPFLEQGDAYDRSDNPRDFAKDLLVREKYGKVQPKPLPALVTGTLEVGSGTVWKNTGTLTFGQLGVDDEVVFSGGQSRIYTDGDVYINANLKYATSSGTHYKDITSVRIEARNIYVSGEVTDLEIQLLAHGEFHSGASKNQLRILGDVIAKQTFWEREPLLENSPTEFNKPSEYLIEDPRKTVVPAPGDTTVPDDANVWRQVNPSTGETLDGF
jgi:uncharacterized repeat protein (TIGR01451 family)